MTVFLALTVIGKFHAFLKLVPPPPQTFRIVSSEISVICLYLFLFFFLATLWVLWHLSSPTRFHTWAPVVRVPSPNHWTAREFTDLFCPNVWFFFNSCFYFLQGFLLSSESSFWIFIVFLILWKFLLLSILFLDAIFH